MTDNQDLPTLHPSVIDRLDPQFVEIYNKYQAPKLRADQVPYEVYNANRSKYSFPIAPGPKPQVGRLETFEVLVTEPKGKINVRVYFPTEEAALKGGLSAKDGRLPAHVEFHGGGFVIGDLETDDSWCRQVCQAVGCIVLNVDYRLAPDYPHPTPLEDSWAPLRWAIDTADDRGIDISRVSIGGISAGGQLAAVLALMARDTPNFPKLVLQLLTVPIVDARFVPLEGPCPPEDPYKSHHENEFAPCLPLNRLRWFYKLWLGTDMEKREELTKDFRASPILASSHANLAPASIHVAGVDSLTSEGITYHETLLKAGTDSTLTIYEGCGHPFSAMDGELEKAKEYVRNTISDLKAAYGAIS
ncbi:hypothetical protein HYALB_00012482 [Hymenoscyphus albidus]|uniref:Alpha/beta hydrolase fold-3 domain-containing protein n=1 Tax=Hymenoscyphus albidus TaxID=595503 RepID=A0A9N9LSJ5_9HELO|nr:hypothetical protein HYALB_00012482 [Hymenoscyphus albidus]